MAEIQPATLWRATWTQEAVMMGAITAAGYWIAFLFEAGYCRYFDVPIGFVDVGLTSILIAIVGVLGGFQFFQLIVLDPLWVLTKGVAQSLRHSIIKMVLIGAFIISYGVVARMKPVGFAIVGGVYALLLFLEYGVPLLTQRGVKGFSNKFEAQMAVDNGAGGTTLLLAESIGRDKFKLIVWCAALSFAAYFAGGFDAKGKKEFMVLTDTPDTVLLKRSGDNFLAAKIDRERKLIFPEFRLIEEKHGLSITIQQLGPLEPVGLDVKALQKP